MLQKGNYLPLFCWKAAMYVSSDPFLHDWLYPDKKRQTETKHGFKFRFV